MKTITVFRRRVCEQSQTRNKTRQFNWKPKPVDRFNSIYLGRFLPDYLTF